MFLLIDKPTTWTSFDAVAYIRSCARAATGKKRIKVGHAGTLDPFATGLLIIAVGQDATRRIDAFRDLTKTYDAEFTLGATSTTYDKTGELSPTSPIIYPTVQDVLRTLQQFRGTIFQIPPMYSAKKVDGQRLYTLARSGQEIVREPVEVTIHQLELVSFRSPDAHTETFLSPDIAMLANQRVTSCQITTTVSKGTYIRSLAHDIGQQLGTGAYCSALRRTMIGPYHVASAVAPKTITAGILTAINAGELAPPYILSTDLMSKTTHVHAVVNDDEPPPIIDN